MQNQTVSLIVWTLIVVVFLWICAGASHCTNVGGSQNNSERRRVGRPVLISERGLRFLARQVAGRSRVGAATYVRLIAADANLPVSLDTVRRALNAHINIVRQRPRVFVMNGSRQQNARLAWANTHLNINWHGMYFFDEARLSLDGSDRPTPLLRDVRIQPVPFIRRVAGGGSVSLLLLLGPSGFTNVSVQQTNVVAADVFQVLSDSLRENDRIMMDNARVHFMSFRDLPSLGVHIVRQPPYSPDLQPVENVFSVLRRRIYEGNRQFLSIDELINRVTEIINIMINSGDDVRLYNSLVASMSGRVSRLISRNGGRVD